MNEQLPFETQEMDETFIFDISGAGTIAQSRQFIAEGKLRVAVEALRKCTDPRLMAGGLNRIAEQALEIILADAEAE